MAEEPIPECQLCDGCNDPDCHRVKLEEVVSFYKEIQKQMANQKVRFTEIMKGEQQLKRATSRLLEEMEKIKNMVDHISEDLDNRGTD